ncbi:MAG: insulinase family protein [Saprospiraceae bacterium]
MIETKKRTYNFESVKDDLLDVQLYTLSNGLKLYLSVNKQQPRIFTNIAIRSGSKQDPPETTGLAHYMEHMLFKGTSKIGAANWEAEKALLEKISDLYEAHRQTQDEDKRKEIYAEIDRTSFEAAKLVAPNEYDKLASSIGATGTNAYTWVDQTVYVNDIPANELARWMELESERFSMMALRLFHTELETVYEEFNINQDKDFRKVYRKIREELFPSHPYGTQTTIGKAEHLRSPSQKNIQKYFSTYYVPNNMAIVLAGDFDPNEVVQLAEQYFGAYEASPLPELNFPEQPVRTKPSKYTVKGQESSYLTLAWRFGSSQTDDPLYLSILQHILYNQQAGMLDLNLNQKQKVLESEAWSWFYQDHSVFGLFGKPREGQSLEEVKMLLLEQIEKLKNGDFEDWLIEACIKDFKLGEIRSSNSNQARVGAMTQSFVLDITWERFSTRIKWIEQLTKADIQAYAKKYLQDNYVAVFKESGTDDQVLKVEKPPITAVELQRELESDYAKAFLSKKSPNVTPEFVDLKAQIQSEPIKQDLNLDYVYNPNNALFQLNYIFEMGKVNDLHLSIALQYLPYLGTDRYSPSDLQKEFFKLGLSFEVNSSDERCYVTLEGLPESLEAGIKLFEHVLAHVQANPEALSNVKADILTKRANSKQDKNTILRDALGSYARYGSLSPFTWRLDEKDLLALKSEELIDRIHALTGYEHKVYYYGQAPKSEVAGLLKKYHQIPERLKSIIPAKKFEQQETPARVLFLDYPIVQADVMMISKGTPQFNTEEYFMTELYNNYFGYGLSSIVFQDIREAKALAYSTYAYYSSPNKADKAHYLQAYVGTQPDKLSDAIPALLSILEDMPVVPQQIRHAQDSILKRMESARISPSHYYWRLRSMQFLGFEEDLRQESYERLKNVGPEDLLQFQQKYVKGRDFTFVVLGSKERIDLDYLSQFGPIEEVTLEQIFGF